MRSLAIILLAACGAMVFASGSPVRAQYYYPYPPPPPGYYGRPPPPDYDEGPPDDYDRPCPPGFTVQGGACRPYRGPVGGGWRTWNGCPPGYTVQGGGCRAYRGY